MRGTALKAFDINRVERNIADQLEKDIATLTPRLPAPPPPDEPRAVTEIGKLSAEAVVREYEAAAKEIEAMGQETARRCEAITASVVSMLEEVKTTATQFRKEAQRIFNEIESCSVITEEVRTTCDALKKRIVDDRATYRELVAAQ
jgi:uncharacterized coiled-coil DUF342 family protein